MTQTTILLSHERSGSHLLGEIVASFSGMRMYDEVCNANAVKPAVATYSFHRFRREWMMAHEAESLAPSRQAQFAFLRGYFDLLAEMAAGQNVAVDIKYGHFHHFEGMWCPLFHRPFLLSFAEAEQISIIHLYRRSAVEAAISDQIAKTRQVWHSWQEPAAETPDERIELDPALIASDAEVLRMQHNWISDRWLGEARVLQITYEQLVEALQEGSSFADLAAFVGGAVPTERHALRHQKVTRSITAAVSNLAEIRSACVEAGLADDPFLEALCTS